LNVAVTNIFPLGHPVEIVSSHPAAGQAAVLRWPHCEAMFDVAPLKFLVSVTEGNGGSPVEFLPAPAGFIVDCGEAGRGSFETSKGTGSLRSNDSSLATLLEALVLTALDWTFFIGIHAGCVMRDGKSVLLCGDSGAGKSTLAYACSQAGWNYVSDNALHWAASPYSVLVSGSPQIRLRQGARELFSLSGEFTGVAGTVSAPAGPCVFLARRPGPATLRPHSREVAMAYFAQFDKRPDRDYAEERYRSLLESGAWLMEYEDVWDAVRCLETFA
jgi:hypothetical protein